MSEFNLGTARGVIELDYQGKGAAEQASKDIDGIKKNSMSTDDALKKVGTGALVAGTAIAGGFALALKSAGDFQQGLSGIQAVSGATTAEMDAVRKKALQLGADTAFSAGDAASAIEELVKAGISIPDVMNGAADATVALAAAGGVDLPQAATIAANAMNQFGLSAAEMPRIADKIAGAANASAIDVADFGQSLTQVGAIANVIGLSFDDTALAITAMGNAGIKGSDAGTSLKTMLTNLQPATKRQSDLMQKLGLITKDGGNQFFDSTGKIKSMGEIAGTLQGALKGMSDAQKTAALETLFGSDAIRAGAIIADTGAAGFEKLGASIDKVKAADVAKTRMDNMAGSMEQLKGSMETASIVIGTMLIPVVTAIVDKLTAWVNMFTSLDASTQKTIATVVGIIGSALLFVGVLIKVVQFVKAAQAAFAALNGVLLANPIILIIALVIALIAIIVYLWKTNDTFRANVTAVWNAVKGAIMAVVNWITGTAVPWIVNAWNAISAGAQELWAKIVSIWDAIKTGISTAITAIQSTVTSIWTAITSFITTALTAIQTTVMTVWNAILGFITTVITTVQSVISTVLTGLLAIWTGIWGMFGPLITAVWQLIVAIVQLYIYAVHTVITTVLNFIVGIWNSTWNLIKNTALAVWNGIKAVISASINAVKAVIASVMNAIKGVIAAVWGAIGGTVMAAVNYIKGVITNTFNAYKNLITTVMNAIKGVVSSVWNTIKSVVTTVLNAINGVVSSVVNSIKSTISTGFNAAKSVATTAFNSIRTAVTTAINGAKTAVSSAISSIKGFFSGAGSWLYGAGKQIIQGLINGIRAMLGGITSAISSITNKIRSFLPGSPIKEGPLKDHGWNEGRPGKQLMVGLADSIDSNMGAVERAFGNIPSDVPISLTQPDVALAASASRTGSGRNAGGTTSAAVPQTKTLNVEFKNYNPIREKSSQSAVNGMARLSALGIFDSGEDEYQ